MSFNGAISNFLSRQTYIDSRLGIKPSLKEKKMTIEQIRELVELTKLGDGDRELRMSDNDKQIIELLKFVVKAPHSRYK
jgi:hypothetical protein